MAGTRPDPGDVFWSDRSPDAGAQLAQTPLPHPDRHRASRSYRHQRARGDSHTATRREREARLRSRSRDLPLVRKQITVKTGTTVTYTDKDSVAADLTTLSGPASFNSGALTASGGTFKFTFA